MASYTLTLTPEIRPFGSEGDMDGSILSGVSIQRTGYIEVWKSDLSKRKIIEAVDGETFDDTTFETGLSVLPVV